MRSQKKKNFLNITDRVSLSALWKTFLASTLIFGVFLGFISSPKSMIFACVLTGLFLIEYSIYKLFVRFETFRKPKKG